MPHPLDDPLLIANRIKPVIGHLGRAPASDIAMHAGLRIEHTYMGLVRLHEMGLTRLHIGPREKGKSINEWELR